MKRLAEAIKLAAKIREECFDHTTCDAVNKALKRGLPTPDYNTFYTKSLWQACDEAAEKMGFDTRGTQSIYLLLSQSWNDALEWADQF